MRVTRRLTTWCGGHPGLSAALVAAAAFALACVGRRGPGEAPLPEPSVLGWVVVALACAALVERVRRPVQVWGAVLALVLVGALLDGAVDRSVPALFVALYTVAAHRPWRTAVGAALASAAVLVGGTLAVTTTSVFDDGTYAMLAFGGMCTAIGIAVRNQRAVVAAAEERARTAEQTREEEAQRRVAEERLRIARELHDVVAHHIAVVNVQAGVARHVLATDPAAADAALGSVRQAAALVLRETGAIIGLLRTTEEPSQTDATPGVARLDELVEEVRRAGLEVTWTVTGRPRPLLPAADLAGYRLVQEALTNARRHGTGPARLAVRWDDDGLLVEVRNALHDKVSATAGQPRGYGLLGMAERVSAAAGRLDVGPAGDEFVVRAHLPYDVDADVPAEASAERA